MNYDVIVIGSGPSGLTAGLYASRANLNTVIIAGANWGGQLMLTTDVENFPGFSNGIQGPMLMEEMRKQSTRFGAEWVNKNATKVDFSSQPFKVWVGDDQPIIGKSVIVATGEETRWLGVPGEKELIGRGVSSCAPCDAAFFKNKRVYVIGGGDAAMEEALVLARFASEVTIIHRRSEFRASKVMAQRILEHEKIKVFWDTEIVELHGGQMLESVVLRTKVPRWGQDKDWMLQRGRGEEIQVSDQASEYQAWRSSIEGVFVAIGHIPSTSLFKGALDLDEKGFLLNQMLGVKDHSNLWLSGYPTMTNVPGVFAVGDGFDYRYRQAITAAAFGCMGAMDAEKWLEKNGLAEVDGSTKW